jgi:hypothetical protein
MSTDIGTFSTERLPLACYLHASGKLRFLRAEPGSNGKARFIFADPQNIGDQLELEYESGAAVSASGLFASQKFLRRKADEALGNRRLEYHGYNR